MGMTQQSLQEREQKRTDFLVSVPTTAGAYAAGNVVGGLLTIDNSGIVRSPIDEPQLSAKLSDVSVIDNANQAIDADIFLFSQAPASAMNDKAAFAPSAADLKNCVGVLHVVAADYIAAGGSAKVAAGPNQRNLNIVMKPSVAGATALYAVVVTRGTPTYGANALFVRMKFDA